MRKPLSAAEVLALIIVITYIVIVAVGLVVLSRLESINAYDVFKALASPTDPLSPGVSVLQVVNDYLGLHLILRGVEVLHGMVWEIVSAIFIHANIIHLITNVVALLITDSILSASAEIRGKDEVVVFMVSGIVGNLATVALLPTVSSLGASGAIFGLLAYATINEFRRSRSLTLLMLLVFVFVISSIPIAGYPNIVAHLAGLMTGIIFGILGIPKSGSGRGATVI